MARKSKSKSKSKSKAKAKKSSKAKSKKAATKSKSGSKTAAKKKSLRGAKAGKKKSARKKAASPRARSSTGLQGARPQRMARRGLAPLVAAAVGPIDTIAGIAAASPIAHFSWPQRGVAPIGYIKGMAVVFARVLCKLAAGDAAAVEMAKANTGNAARDALAHYDSVFAGLGMSNAVSGPDTLRHLFALMVGHGMRESSGQFCVGQDRSAPENQTANRAEAGLLQTSFDARSASPLLPVLFASYTANPAGFVNVFKQGCPPCKAKDLENFGSGPGRDFQKLSKESPAFAVEFGGVTLRNERKHYGPINTRAAKVMPDCDAMLHKVQDFITASPGSCPLLV
jgi:hypothetical protein